LPTTGVQSADQYGLDLVDIRHHVAPAEAMQVPAATGGNDLVTQNAALNVRPIHVLHATLRFFSLAKGLK
jgi:hypothetical protein